MISQKPLHRALLGTVSVIIVVVVGFGWLGLIIPTWGSTPEEVTRALPADELVPQPSLIWNNALTIHASVGQVYPWLVQIGDSRAAFYSITFIENAFCATSGACRAWDIGVPNTGDAAYSFVIDDITLGTTPEYLNDAKEALTRAGHKLPSPIQIVVESGQELIR